MLQPATFSISRLNSTKGRSRSSASSWPSVDLPAPRRPTSAMRPPRARSPPGWPSSSVSAMRARRSSTSLRCSSSSRISSHSGLLVVTSPSSSASGHCNALATCCSTRIDALPMPYSRLAKCRSDTSAASAACLRVRPRRARSVRTRSPSASSSGFLASSVPSAASIVVPSALWFMFLVLARGARGYHWKCTILLDAALPRRYLSLTGKILHRA